jgi:hypothetical protein
VLWWTIASKHYDVAVYDTRPNVNYAVLFAFQSLSYSAAAMNQALPVSPFGHASECARMWQRLSDRGARFATEIPRWLPALGGRPLAEYSNPFEPMATIEELGYATLEYTAASAQGGAVLLVAARPE